MPRVDAALELLAPPDDVWAFLAEPRHFADWWPNVAAVEPDRRGLAPGARWQIHPAKPTYFRKPDATGMLLVTAVEPARRWAFQLVGDRMSVELLLEPYKHDHTVAELVVSGPWLIGLSKRLPRRALGRLFQLVQTADDG